MEWISLRQDRFKLIQQVLLRLLNPYPANVENKVSF
jgi:hypothetical protein